MTTGSTTVDHGAQGVSARLDGPPASARPERARALTSSEAQQQEQLALADVDAAFCLLAAAEGELDDGVTREIRRRRAAVDAAAARPHYTLAVLGRDAAQRTRLLNDLLGQPLVDPARDDPIAGFVRFRHGPSPGYRARFAGGEAENFASIVPDRSEELGADVARERGRLDEAEALLRVIQIRLERDRPPLDARRAEVESAEAELDRLHHRRAVASRDAAEAEAERKTALATADERDALVPRYLRERPPWWAFWLWIARVFASRRYRNALASVAALRDRASRLHDHRDRAEARFQDLDEALEACERRRAMARATCEKEERRVAELEGEARAHRGRVRECEQALRRAEERLTAFLEDRRERFVQRVRALTDARADAGQVESLQVELPSLPAYVEVLDVGGTSHALDLQRAWELVDREADGCAIAGGVPRQARLLFGGAIRTATPDVLVARLRRGRALRALRQAAEACRGARQSLEAASARAAEQTRRRIEVLRRDRDAGERRLEGELVRLQAQVKGRAASALVQAGNHIEWELERLSTRWLGDVRRSESLAALRSTLASVEAEAAESMPAIAADARALLVSGLSGILAELTVALAGQRSDPPALSPPGTSFSELEFAPFPDDPARALSVAPPRLSAHLQAFATTRAGCERTLASRLAELRRCAAAALLHLEPQTATHLANALDDVARALYAAHERGYQRAIDEVRAEADAGASASRDELRAEITALARGLEQHEGELVGGL